MYTALLAFHSYWRWVLLALLLLTFGRALSGWLGDKPYKAGDARLSLLTMIATDVQLLTGLLLYFAVSPVTQGIFSNFGAAMKDKMLRFWAVEHITLTIVAVVAVHLSRVLARKVEDGRARHKRVAIALGVALLVILVAIPWPFREAVGRKLFFGL